MSNEEIRKIQEELRGNEKKIQTLLAEQEKMKERLNVIYKEASEKFHLKNIEDNGKINYSDCGRT